MVGSFTQSIRGGISDSLSALLVFYTAAAKAYVSPPLAFAKAEILVRRRAPQKWRPGIYDAKNGEGGRKTKMNGE
jgi:hypothetical protein